MLPPRARHRFGVVSIFGRPAAIALAALAAGAGCAARPRVGGGGAGAGAAAGARATPAALPAADLGPVYRRMGLVVAGGDVPFVARLAYLAGPTPDSTLAHLTLSLAARALTFAREGTGYRAAYQVRLEVRPAPAAGAPRPAATLPVLREAVGAATVRVATFRETARADESVVHAQALALAPGRYTLAVTVRDAESGRATAAEVPVRVPRLGAGVPGGGLATPVAVYEARPRARAGEAPSVLVNARATAVFGRDSAAFVYLEAYGAPRGGGAGTAGDPGAAGDPTPGGAGVAAGPATVPATLLVRDDRGAEVWRDTVALARAAGAGGAAGEDAPYAAVARVPVARAGFGVLTVHAARRDLPADTAASALFVTFGDELPAPTFDEALGYLRDFAPPARLRALRAGAPAARPARWAEFLRETDPDPRTPAHEALEEHVARLRAAAARFAEAGAAGWATDRGRAYVVLGEPDQITDANVPEQGQRGRTQVWEYREPRVQLVFVDRSGLGRWRLAPAGAAALDAAVARRFAAPAARAAR